MSQNREPRAASPSYPSADIERAAPPSYPSADIERAASCASCALSVGPRAPISAVEPGSPADDAGFYPGCFLTSVDGAPLRDVIDWRWLSDGDEIRVGYLDADGDAGEAVLERENISEEIVRTILRKGAVEQLNDWTIRFTHDDYRVDVNTASAEIITVIDEYDAEYNEAAQVSLAHGKYNSLNALELEFSERARTFLKKNPPFVFDLMLHALSNPESVRMAEGWTRIYAAQGLEIAISPDERTVMALAKSPDFHHLHAKTLRKAQLEELSNALAQQAEDSENATDQAEDGVTQAENTTEEENNVR